MQDFLLSNWMISCELEELRCHDPVKAMASEVMARLSLAYKANAHGVRAQHFQPMSSLHSDCVRVRPFMAMVRALVSSARTETGSTRERWSPR